MSKTLRQSLKTGWVVIGLLGVLTVIEFAVAMSTKDALLLALLLGLLVAHPASLRHMRYSNS